MRDSPKMVLQRLGGGYQLRIEKPEDLERLQDLDEALWVATSIPISSLSCDRTFAEFVDTDKNGRIRTDELKAAQSWLFRMLKDRSRLSEGTSVLLLDAIDTSHEEGRNLRAAAERILSNLGQQNAGQITLEQVRNRQKIMASGAANGDGVIPPEAAREEVGEFIRDVMACVGSARDASGKEGITRALLEKFAGEARAYLEWRSQGDIPPGKEKSSVMVWGTQTPSCYQALAGIEEKVEEYFLLCALARFDERLSGQVRLGDEELKQMEFADRAAMEKRLLKAPIAPPNPDGVLIIDGNVNEMYREKLHLLRELVLSRLPDAEPGKLSSQTWKKIKAEFAPYRNWLEGKKGASVEKLGAEKLRSYLDSKVIEEVRHLIAADEAVAGELRQVRDVERLILYQQWLMELANNFVSFPRLYDPHRRSMVEKGTLIMDGRRFTLNTEVKDRNSHKKIARLSHTYIMYLKVVGADEKETFEVATAVTAGDTGRICIGKRGIFRTIDGRNWDATVVDIIPNPIGLWEALVLPFRRLSEFVRTQVEKITSAVTKPEKIIKQAISQPQPAGATRSGAIRDILLGGGVAVAALGTGFAYVTKALKDVHYYHILYVVGGILLIVIVPTLISALVKLSRRNISMLLEACGWAVNAKLKLNARLGGLFTLKPPFPRGAQKFRIDLAKTFISSLRKGEGESRKGLLALLLVVVFFLAALAVAKMIWFRAQVSPRADWPAAEREVPQAEPSEEAE